MQEALLLRRRRRTLVDCHQLQSSTESILEFTAPPSASSKSAAAFVFPAESEVIELLKMAYILQVSEISIIKVFGSMVTWYCYRKSCLQ